MAKRLFTADEQRRLNERAEMLDRSFMWTSRVPLSDRLAILGREWLAFGLPALLVSLCIAVIVCRCLALPELDIISCAVLVAIVAAAIEIAAFGVRFVVISERERASLPAFVFLNDKLYHISENIRDRRILAPRIPKGELSALREIASASVGRMPARAIEAECMCLDVIGQAEIGNDVDGISVEVIEEIDDISFFDEAGDEIERDGGDQTGDGIPEGAAAFAISYEEDGEPKRCVLGLSSWRDLCIWLVDQMQPS